MSKGSGGTRASSPRSAAGGASSISQADAELKAARQEYDYQVGKAQARYDAAAENANAVFRKVQNDLRYTQEHAPQLMQQETERGMKMLQDAEDAKRKAGEEYARVQREQADIYNAAERRHTQALSRIQTEARLRDANRRAASTANGTSANAQARVDQQNALTDYLAQNGFGDIFGGGGRGGRRRRR